MTEFELRFQLPTERAAGVMRALARGKVTRRRLDAEYYDTTDQALARRGVTVRLRKEGRRWVQTAKAAGESLLHRLEHSIVVQAAGTARAVPAVNWRLHEGTPVGDLIAEILEPRGTQSPPVLHAIYQSKVQRLARIVRVGRTSVEIALDRGWIEAPGGRACISELEFELKKGAPEDAIALARRWCAMHACWLSTISKAERGQRLALHPLAVQARPARAPTPESHSGQDFAKAVLHACLEQVLANASEVASRSTDSEHAHQVRIGVRRLRTAMREFHALLPQVDAHWDAPWIRLFRELGRQRDTLYLEQLQSRLEAVGGPALKAGHGDADAVAAVRAASFQDALLAMLGLVHGPWEEQGGNADPKQVKVLLVRRLGRLRKAVLADGREFDRLSTDRQHRVRKRVKRLRYLSEFSQGFFRGKQVEKFLDRLKPLQDSLGEYNDELLALGRLREWADIEPEAWFGAGWLSARQVCNAAACAKAIRDFGDVRPFWK